MSSPFSSPVLPHDGSFGHIGSPQNNRNITTQSDNTSRMMDQNNHPSSRSQDSLLMGSSPTHRMVTSNVLNSNIPRSEASYSNRDLAQPINYTQNHHNHNQSPNNSPTTPWFFQKFMRRGSSFSNEQQQSAIIRSSSTSAIDSLSREDLDSAIMNNNGIPIVAAQPTITQTNQRQLSVPNAVNNSQVRQVKTKRSLSSNIGFSGNSSSALPVPTTDNIPLSSELNAHTNSNSAASHSSPNLSHISHNSERGIILDSCKCCGTVIKYPANVTKIRCMICQTTLRIATSNQNKTTVPITSLPKEDTAVPLTYKTVKQMVTECHKYLDSHPEEEHNSHEVFKPLEDVLFKTFSSYEVLNKSFILDPNKKPTYHSPNIDFHGLLKFYSLILHLPTKRPFYKLVLGSLSALKHPPNMVKYDEVIWLLIIFEIPTFKECLVSSNTTSTSSNQTNTFLTSDLKKITYDLLKRVSGLITNSDKKNIQYIIHWWSRLPKEELIKKIELANLSITFFLTRCINYELYNSIIKPGVNLNMYNAEDDINYKESFNMHFMRPTADSKDFGLDIGIPLYISSSVDRNSIQKNKKNDHMVKIKLSQYGDDWKLRVAGKLAYMLFIANQTTKQKKLPDAIFYNNLVDYVNVKQDFDAWQFSYCQRGGDSVKREDNIGPTINPDSNINSMQLVIEYLQAENRGSYLGLSSADGTLSKKSPVTFCQFPFLISLAAKISILEHEAKRMMERKAEEAFIQSLNKKVPIDIQFKIRVRRNHITADSLRSIKFHQNDFKKSLKIEFVDEPGIDAGGLKKEWFLLLTKELFHPDKGLFSYDDESHLSWFAISSFENVELFYLVGVVVGLAIYNSTILDLKFPLVLYKKLMGVKPNLDDFIQWKPETGNNLRKLLKLKTQEEIDSLELYFEISYTNIFGEVNHRALIPNGKDIKVDINNKYDYVERYTSFYLNEIIESSYNSFAKGFQNVIGGNALSLFTPEEIELLVAGDDNNQKIDVEILKSVTKYTGFGKDKEKSVIENCSLVNWFWEYFQNLTIKNQRKLLSFITGSDRIPATGLTSLNLKITKLSSDENDSRYRLPISHTCFNELCLYDYPSKDVFFQKMEMAITCSEGFGLK